MGKTSFYTGKYSDKPINVKFPPLHVNQQVVYDSHARFKVLNCGRRFGKTNLSYRYALENALIPGGGRVWYIAPSYQISYQAWKDMLRLAGPLIVEKREMEKFFTLKNGGEIYFKSCASDEKLRGSGLNAAVLDEASFMPNGFFNEVVYPMLVDRHGSAMFPSTPNGINWFYDIYNLGFVPNDLWHSFHFTSYDNPYIDPKELDMLKETMSDLQFRQEILAEFLDQSGAVFKNIREICILAPNRVAQSDHMYVAGIDWGGVDDFSVISVFDATTHEQVYFQRIRETDFASQRAMIKGVIDFYGIQSILAEQNTIGEPNIQALRAEGIPVMPFVTSQATKHQLVQELIHNMETQSIRLLNDQILIDELMSYSASKSKNGQYSYSASRGHDDVVMATMLANHLLGQPKPLYSSVTNIVRVVPRIAVKSSGNWNGHTKPEDINFGGFQNMLEDSIRKYGN